LGTVTPTLDPKPSAALANSYEIVTARRRCVENQYLKAKVARLEAGTQAWTIGLPVVH